MTERLNMLSCLKKIPKDSMGFVDATKYTPPMFELCQLVTDKGRTRMGWWTGFEYYGMKIKDTDKIVAWKKCHVIGP